MSVPATPSEQHPPPASPLEITASITTSGSQEIISSESVVQSSHKLDDGDDGSPVPPALPPRPPPRPRQLQGGSAGAAAIAQLAAADRLEELTPGLQQQIRARVLRRSCWLRKYVFLCTACGGLAVLLGALFLTVYFMLRSYTSSLNYFETVPTYVPAAMLMVTGLIVMCLAGRRNRYGYLIKLCGCCCLACAVLCVIVTITTTVIHMNRLQMLRECVYTKTTQTCTCFPVPVESTTTARATSDIVHYVFNSTPDCEVIHGALYSCLRAMFGLSVIGILVCIFSCMLIYQLLSHEKKKMYWEQLEMRCRYLYRQQRNPHHCTCCDECQYPPPHQLFPWEVMDDSRYWTPGRVGNFYSPNPGEDPGSANVATQRLRGQERTSAWSWRRLPWSRGPSTNVGQTHDHSHREGSGSGVQNYRQATSSPDSQYGFSSHPAPADGTSPPVSAVVEGNTNAYIRDPHGGPVIPQPTGGFIRPRTLGPFVTEGSVKAIQQPQGYAQQYYMWGPPPPYSNPHSGNNSHCNSPARREPILNLLQGHPGPTGNATTGSPSRLHYQHHHHLHHHHHHCQMNQQGANRNVPMAAEDQSIMSGQSGLLKNLQQRYRGGVRRLQDQRRFDEFSSPSGDGVINTSSGDKSVIVENYVNTSEAEIATSGDVMTSENNTDSSISKDRISNTLPARKTKKHIDISSIKSVANIPFSSEHQLLSQKSSPSHYNSGNNVNSGSGCSSTGGGAGGNGSAGNGGAGFPRTNVQLLFRQQDCQLSNLYHSGNNSEELSAEETQLVAEKYPHSLPSSSALVRGKDGTITGVTPSNMSPRMRYMSHLQGVTNSAFQVQEGLELQDQQGQILCGKNEPTESEVYFADVSSCCNVSVRNDGSLYDEALDPQKHRLMILNQEGEPGIPTSGSHLQRLPESYPMHHHHHHRRLLQTEVTHPSGNHHQFQRVPLQEGVIMTDKVHQNHHRVLSEGSTLPLHCEEQELTSNCFSYQRQSSTRNRLPFPLPHHHLLDQNSSTVEESMQEGIGCKNVVSSSREFIDAESIRKMCISNNGRSDIPKDPSQQSLSVSSNSSATPTAETNDIAFVSPMSLSASSPGSFPTEELENCGSYYDNHNNSSEVGSSSGSTSAVCSPMSSSGNDVFASPTHSYSSPQKIPYDQGPTLQHANRLHQMQQRNNNYQETITADFVQVHGADQHFLAPDAQYETIPQQQPQNIAQSTQAYQHHIYQQNFPQMQQEDFNGNTPTNSPGKNNLSCARQGGVMAPPVTLSIGGNVTSPARRRLNLPLHVTSAVSSNTNSVGSPNNNSNNTAESLYHTATSTEEEESESHQPQSSSNCYSDETMDSGCHSGSEFATRRRGGSSRASARGGTNKEHSRAPVIRTEEDECGEELPVKTIRSVNV